MTKIKIPVKAGAPRVATGMTGVQEIDTPALARDLTGAVEGEVRFDTASRGLYATDASNYRQPPIGVVIPRTVDDVVATHAVCHSHHAPILCRGCGTSLSGETVNYAVVIDFSKYLHGMGDLDVEQRTVRAQPGAINQKLNEYTGRSGLVFGPDPSTHAYCTVGGNIGNNSCGIHSLQSRMAGLGSRTSDNVADLEVLTYDGLRMRVGPTSDDELEHIVASGGRRGQIYRDLRDLRDRYAGLIRERFVDIPRRVSGYSIDELLPEKGFNVARALVGTEGTCVTVLDATLLLVPEPPARSMLVVGYEDVHDLADHLTEILEHEPIACEGIDHQLFVDEQQKHMHPAALSQLPEGRAWALVEFGGETRDEANEKARRLEAALEKGRRPPSGVRLVDTPEQERALWEVRESALAATAFPPDGADAWPGWEDAAVPPDKVGAYLRDLQDHYAKHGVRGALYGHLGDGCIHSRISFDLRTADGLRTYRTFMEEAADLVVSYGGSLSGEHGDGQQRAELLPRMYGDDMVDAFRQFKRIWDPDWKMNPGKIVDPFRFDEDLKLGTDYNPWRPPVRFAYEDDGGDFAHAALRCVGVGKCRRPDGENVMCPSFMVLREEKHTTRGRARLLFEMLEGEVVTDGWRSQEVKDALDLCLACKGCTNDCPVNVDMPTYKAEFLHHHWKGRLRPRHAYALGLIDQAARVASRVPHLANLMTHAPGLSRLAKWAGGVTQNRSVPSFAPTTLQQWFRRRGPRNVGGPKVVVWPDTFNNHFHTDVGVAAVEAIEAAGWQVVMPDGHVCCGRPLYDYGMLDLAERYLRRTLDVLRPSLREGLPVVGIEPSCLATFKEELPKLLPHDDDGRRLRRQAHHYADFFQANDIDPPPLAGKALVWGHCHHKATGGLGAEHELLRRMGLDVETARGGCCGLAGSWGYEAGHHEISVQAGEQVLLPRVRAASPDTLVVADGFSCKSQIEEGGTGRRALHVAEVLDLAHRTGGSLPAGRAPETLAGGRPRAERSWRRLALAGVAASLTVGAAAARHRTR